VTTGAADATRIRPPGEEPRSGEARLVFVEGEAVLGVSIGLAGEVVLGRDAACEVPLAADDVSRRHARVVPDGDGHVVVDLGSTNGTWVNGREIEAHRLSGGDRIRVGSFVATYVAAGDAAGRHLEELARLARRDPLTGLPNRRALEEELSRAVARAVRAASPLAAIVLDVDRFKQVNDTHGHAAGDGVLAAVAARAAGALRAGDLLARIGGEEFAVVLAGADLAAAAEAAERIRAAVAAAPLGAEERALAVTVSLGCAELAAGEDGPALLARADARLYDAKRAGRNRVAT
jgi:two-component system cell cycle response regulator